MVKREYKITMGAITLTTDPRPPATAATPLRNTEVAATLTTVVVARLPAAAAARSAVVTTEPKGDG